MKRNIWAVVFLSISFLLQSTLFSQFNIGGTVPNILLVCVAALGFLQGRRFGLWAGFLSGLLVDVFFGRLIGLYALMYMLVGYSNGFFKRVLFPRDIKMPLMLIAASDFVYGNVCYITLFLLNGRFNYSYYFKGVILPELVYTSVMACVLYPMIHSVYRRIEEKEKEGDSYIAQE